MEVEMEPRVKPLSYKVKATSRESPAQKASNVLEADLRSHWSSSTNTKEWILLELDEPCLLSHIRIYNKSVLEWEIAVGLRYKPETFVKVRPRCESPRRDMIYPMNYTPCRYVRISCLRGNPIAIFFIQLFGVPVTGLEPEFQPVVNHLLPHILSHRQDSEDMHLQLLQDITSRLQIFLPQIEAELAKFPDAAEDSLRFLAMLVGPLYPILHIVKEREATRSPEKGFDSEAPKNSQPSSSFTVSSNFEPRRSRSNSAHVISSSSTRAFRADAVFKLLRKAYRESYLGAICRTVARILHKLLYPVTVQEALMPGKEVGSGSEEMLRTDLHRHVNLADYSSLFGEEFQMSDDNWDFNILNILDTGAVEEGLLHVLYACASQPLLCSKLAESTSGLWSALPLVQALLPALLPAANDTGDNIDDNFSQWKQKFVQQALSQVVRTSCSVLYHPLLHACAGYLSSFSPSHARAACVLIDLCSSVLAHWMPQVVAKVDLTIELLEDLLGVIQGVQQLAHARAALKYIVLALSGHMDDMLWKYKEAKHRMLFLLEMLEPFLDPVMHATRNTISFGDASFPLLENQEQLCAVALKIIRSAVQKPAVLPSLESEWRSGSVAPSVLLLVLEPHMQLPPEIDLCKPAISENIEPESSTASNCADHQGEAVSKSSTQDDFDGKNDASEIVLKFDMHEDSSLLFAPPELRALKLSNGANQHVLNSNHSNANIEQKHETGNLFSQLIPNCSELDVGFAAEYANLQADFFQLVSYGDCERKASEFRHLALDLHSQHLMAVDAHDAAVDALLLAAECYLNPFFMASFRSSPNVKKLVNDCGSKHAADREISEMKKASTSHNPTLQTVAVLEKKRDKMVLELLLEAAELDRKYWSASDRQLIKLSSFDYTEAIDEPILKLSSFDIQAVDAITLVRQNQALLCNFLIRRIKKNQESMHEILMHCLVFLLHSATQLFCAPEEVIDIILGSAEYLNKMLTSFYYEFKESYLQLTPEKIHMIQRYWILLQRLVIASSGCQGSEFVISTTNGFRCGNLIPPSTWIQRISTFSCSGYPLVRFLGWMAISRNARQYLKDRLFLTSDLSELTYLLSIFSDELAVVDNIINQKLDDNKLHKPGANKDISLLRGFELTDRQQRDQFFRVVHPDMSKFFPNLKKQFESFGECILEAVGLQLRSLSSSLIPDMLCWFSDLCSWKFPHNNQISSRGDFEDIKGYVAKNARTIILFILEAIVVEHMEAMVPEVPRVLQVLVSLCRTSFCDVSFLNSILRVLKPIVSYSLQKVAGQENEFVDDSCLNFETLCFEELFVDIKQRNLNEDITRKDQNRALPIFILASIFTDLSPRRRNEILQSLILWADFTESEPTATINDYLCAFQTILDGCKLLLVQTLRRLDVVPVKLSHFSDLSTDLAIEKGTTMHSWFLNDACDNSCSQNESEAMATENYYATSFEKKNICLADEEVEEFSKEMENLIAKLHPTIEHCWNLHPTLTKKLTVISAQCFVYSRCLSSVVCQVESDVDGGNETSLPSNSATLYPSHWRIGLNGLAEAILKLQESHCWEVASSFLDCLFGVPHFFRLDDVINTICSAIKTFFSNAPKISWRLRSDKWLTMLLERGIHSPSNADGPLIDLFVALLSHPEPEQRMVMLHHLSKLLGQNVNAEAALQPSTLCNKLFPPGLVLAVPESFLSVLVSSTWDQVVLLVSSDSPLPLRTQAMVLLVSYIPYAARQKIQSFLAAVDSVLHALSKISYQTCEGPLLQLSLALIAVACVYSPAEDISLIPQDVWRTIEFIRSSRTGKLSDLVKNACEALCRLKSEGNAAKKVLKEVFSSSVRQEDADFKSTRESILQVLNNLSTVQSYFDMFAKKVDQEEMEREEAELELEIIQNEHLACKPSEDSKEERQISWLTASTKDGNRIQQIKELIRSLEKSKLREEIAARRQKKVLMRHARRKYLEEAALVEEELLRELDREKAAEAEKEIERQRQLELERAKTRELRYNLELEKEKQMQREIQRELEQAESGVRSSRRDFSSSSHASRPRERYRDRENGRSSNEPNARTSAGSLQPDASTSMATPTVPLSSSRSFSGQPPTILQSRDRQDDGGSNYEENFDGSKDSGDTSSVGDPEMFDGQLVGYGSGQRHGSRGSSKSRQGMERRDRDGRREGKWERKH